MYSVLWFLRTSSSSRHACARDTQCLVSHNWKRRLCAILWSIVGWNNFSGNAAVYSQPSRRWACLLFMFSSIEAMHWFSVSKKNCQSLLYTLYAASPNLAAFFRCFAKNSSKIPSRTNRCEKCATYASCTLKSNAIILLKRRFFVIAKERCEELALHAANEGRALHWNRKRKTH